MSIISNYKDLFESNLSSYLDEISSEEIITDALKYSILNGGKRLRPSLMALGALSVNNDESSYSDIKNLAIAIELIHSYSLVHDDLPCMDNDTYRRGKLTTHAKYGAGMATITGDAMLNLALECTLSNVESLESIEDYKAQIDAVKYLFNASGIYGMIEGQAIDIQNNKLSLDETIKMYSLKTSALLRAALVCGAIREKATDDIIKAYEQYSENVGILFQIVDDILDKTSDIATLGKDVNKDSENNKQTIVDLLGGVDNAYEICLKYAQNAKDSIKVIEDKISYADEFYSFVDKMLTRQK